MSGPRVRTTVCCACLLVWISFSGSALRAAPEEVPTLDHPPTKISSEESALSLADLERLALEHNPTLVQAAASVASSRGKSLQAGLWPNPTIGYDGDQIGASGTVGELQGMYVQQVIITAGKRRLSRAKYRQEAYEAELLALAQQFRVLNGVRMRYYELLALQRVIELHRDLLANAEESLRTYKEMFNTGQANEADALLAEVQVNDARIALLTVENRYPALWQHLTALLASPQMPPAPLRGHLEPEGPPLDWDSNLNRLLEESPELKAAKIHVVHDEITVQREKVQPIPDLQLRGASGYNFESNKAVAAGIEVGINLPVWNRNQGTIRQAQADLVRSQAEVVRVELSLRQRLADTFNQYRTAWQTAKIYHDAIIPQTTQAYEVQLDMYKKRRISWPEVVVLQRKTLEAQAQYTRNLLRLREAEVAIRGLLLIDGLTAPPTPQANEQLEATPQPR
ncbi:MAG TPA: TolC family protein [Gemmataceae bacterium]|jgi:cobalt-zinc-cadmium efflux system outer membrane protein